MTKGWPKSKKICGVTTLALACIVIGVLWTRHDVSRIEGKSIPEWLDSLGSRDFEDRAEAREVVNSLGTNVLPILQEFISSKDSWMKKKLILLSDKQSIVNLPLTSASDRHTMARDGYAALGTSSIPHLIELLDDPVLLYSNNPAYEASRVLNRFGSDAVPALVAALTNNSSNVRYHATFCLGWYEALQSDAAIVPLTKLMDDPEWTVRSRAAIALGSLGRNPEVSVEALVRGLRDPESVVRYHSANGLAKFGEMAAPARLALMSAQNEERRFPISPSEPGIIGKKSREEVNAAISNALSAIKVQNEEIEITEQDESPNLEPAIVPSK